jgi:hypothetical protein
VGSNVTVIITREENKYKLKIDDIIAGYPFQTEIEIIVSQSGNNLAISSEPGTATVGPITTQVTITSGTITAAGAINFDIEIIGLENLGAPSNTATYSGQKLENLAKAVSGTYEGVVSIGQQPISAPNAEIVLTVVDRTTVKWTTSTQIMLPSEYGGAQTFTIAESDNFTLNVAGGSGTYTLTGEGTTSLGPITISSGSVEGKDISLTMSSGQLPVSIIYEGKKQ